ncbi:MAG: phosphoenolpyruvate--protein phosphotransferase [Rhodospirillales bacterium]|nr:phosphoenolpyruvate--protein phosphotransferase [Rhodospirillales bacterium]
MAKTPGWLAARRLLKQLRDLLQQGGPAARRLDQVTRLIANYMVAEVCSLYLTRAGEMLELFATIGLKPESVNRTRFRFGEGLVGQIAASGRPLALADAQNHPNFAFRPEIGEESFHSLMGVPILREGQTLGVLVVQNVTPRTYSEEELDSLEIISLVVSEILASSGLVSTEERRLVESSGLLPARLTAMALTEGIGIGEAVSHHRSLVIRRFVSHDLGEELKRLHRARDEFSENLDRLLKARDLAGSGEHHDVFETYRMFVHDRGWIARIEEAVKAGLTAEAAIQRVQSDLRQRMGQVTDPYLRERLHDLDDLANRLLQHLVGGESPSEQLPAEAILIACNLGPSDLLDYDRSRLKGVVLGEGGPTTHVTIVARALGLPMVGRCPSAMTEIRPGDPLIVDADQGQVLVRPREQVLNSFHATLTDRDRRLKLFAETRDLPTVSKDGVRVSLQMNAGLMLDLPQLHACGAEGIGLYRTEISFLVRESFPTVAEQRKIYTEVLDQAAGKPVNFRTLDIGGDKALPYWSGKDEDNPALGWRAIRIGLGRPIILRRQLRALIAAAAGRELSLLLPMISTLDEVVRAKSLIQMELALAAEPPTKISCGVMLEVPALLWQLDGLFDLVDYIAVGSNDLLQFLFASDRGNPVLARRYGLFESASIRLFTKLTERAEARGVPLSLCGDSASHPIEALMLLACGFRRLSMPPVAMAPVRMMIRSLDLVAFRAFINSRLGIDSAAMQHAIRAYALDHGIVLS